MSTTVKNARAIGRFSNQGMINRMNEDYRNLIESVRQFGCWLNDSPATIEPPSNPNTRYPMFKVIPQDGQDGGMLVTPRIVEQVLGPGGKRRFVSRECRQFACV